MTFERFALDERVLSGVRRKGYEQPTPIQEKAITPIMDGKDVLGLAKTGTGKTAAFALPLLHRLLEAKAQKNGPVRTLVLAPTRELAFQIQEDFIDLGRQTGIRCAAVFGGVPQSPQVRALRQSTLVVACPGRLLDLMQQGLANMDHVDTLVLDEADHMLDMGFAPDIKRILERLPGRRQTLLFSATMPQEIRTMADDLLEKPVKIKVSDNAPSGTISHSVYPVQNHCKAELLEALLHSTPHESVIVFTRTKHRAQSLARKLEAHGWASTCLQGNQTQSRRREAMSGFKSGKYKVLVATDIAARGIDCDNVTHVINFDIPDTAEAYTHRSGRTGRALRCGQALTFVTPQDTNQIRAIERCLKQSIERTRLEGFDYNRKAAGPGRQDEKTNTPKQRPAGGFAKQSEKRSAGEQGPGNRERGEGNNRRGSVVQERQAQFAEKPKAGKLKKKKSKKGKSVGVVAGSKPSIAAKSRRRKRSQPQTA